jgi:hypothetical protein
MLLAVASRETNIQDIVGDRGHGRAVPNRRPLPRRRHRRWRDPQARLARQGRGKDQAEGDTFKSIEGNTNDDGSYEGYEVCARVRGYAGIDFIVM